MDVNKKDVIGFTAYILVLKHQWLFHNKHPVPTGDPKVTEWKNFSLNLLLNIQKMKSNYEESVKKFKKKGMKIF